MQSYLHLCACAGGHPVPGTTVSGGTLWEWIWPPSEWTAGVWRQCCHGSWICHGFGGSGRIGIQSGMGGIYVSPRPGCNKMHDKELR